MKTEAARRSRVPSIVVSVLLATPVVILFLLFFGLWVRGWPSEEARANYDAFVAADLGEGPFTIAAFKTGEWRFACVGGEYLADFDNIAQRYAKPRGYAVKPVDDFTGDIVAMTPWAIAMFDSDGNHFTWHMNEKFLRYRLREDQAHGWCFEADEEVNVLDGQFLDLPGRD
jgi:hypothetical protein